MGTPAPPSSAAEARPRQRPVALSSTAVFLISVVVQGLGLVVSIALTHTIAPQVNSIQAALLGAIAFLLLIASSINQVGDLRIGSAFTFFVSRGQQPQQSTWTYFVVRLAMVGAAGVLVFIALPLSAGLSGQAETIALIEQYIPLFAVWMTFPVLWSVGTVYTQLWIGLGNSIRAQAPTIIESVVRTSGLLLVALYAYLDPSIRGDESWILWALTAGYAAGVIASSSYCLPTVLRLRAAFSRIEIRRMFRFAWPLMGSLALLYLSGSLTPLLVGISLGASLFLVFTIVNGFRILLISLPNAVSVPLFPHLVRRYKVGDYEGVRQQTWRALRYTAMALIPGVAALVVYRVNFIIIFFPPSYAAYGAVPLAILAVSAIPAALSQIIGTTLNSIGQQRLELYLTSVQVTALIVALVLILPPVNILASVGVTGLAGPAVALLLSGIAGLAVNLYFMERLIAMRIQLRSVALITVAALLSFLVVRQLNVVLNPDRWYLLLFAVFLGFLTYAVALALMGELAKDDVDQIASAFGIPRSIARPFRRISWRASPIEVAPAPPGTAAGLRPGASRWDTDDGTEPGALDRRYGPAPEEPKTREPPNS